MSPRARRRRGERGFTLIEALVTLALLGIVGTVIGVVFTIGLRSILNPGASRDRLAAASDAISIQQLLTEDVHQATCIEVPGQGTTDYGSCAGETPPFDGRCGSNLICVEWPDLADLTRCDMAIYTLSPAGTVSRSAWAGGTELSSSAVTTHPVAVALTVTPIVLPADWPVELAVTVTSAEAQLVNPAKLSFQLEPLATQPWPTDPAALGSLGPC